MSCYADRVCGRSSEVDQCKKLAGSMQHAGSCVLVEVETTTLARASSSASDLVSSRIFLRSEAMLKSIELRRGGWRWRLYITGRPGPGPGEGARSWQRGSSGFEGLGALLFFPFPRTLRGRHARKLPLFCIQKTPSLSCSRSPRPTSLSAA